MELYFYSLSELPECQVPLAKRTDVIDQILAMALHPVYDCDVAKDSMDIILNLTQSPETHNYIVTRDVVEKMLEICKQRSKMVNEQSSKTHQGEKNNLMLVNALKYVALSHFSAPLSFSFTHTQHMQTHSSIQVLY